MVLEKENFAENMETIIKNTRKVLTESGANATPTKTPVPMEEEDKKVAAGDADAVADPKELAKSELSEVHKHESAPFDPSIEPLLRDNPGGL